MFDWLQVQVNATAAEPLFHSMKIHPLVSGLAWFRVFYCDEINEKARNRMSLLFLLYIALILLTVVIEEREADGRPITEQNIHIPAMETCGTEILDQCPVDQCPVDIQLNWEGFLSKYLLRRGLLAPPHVMCLIGPPQETKPGLTD